MSDAKGRRWKKGRGKLGVLDPLIGAWRAETDSPMGPLVCFRTFARALNRSYVLLDARWEFAEKAYIEHAVFGPGEGGSLVFWSFTSDGKRSEGKLADVTDVHPEAIGFEAQMPAGLARMIYWPGDDEGFSWAVESRNKAGWKRFAEHRYRKLSEA